MTFVLRLVLVAVMSSALLTPTAIGSSRFAEVSYSPAPNFVPLADQRSSLLIVAAIFKRRCDATEYAGWTSKDPATDLNALSSTFNATLSRRYLVRKPDFVPVEVDKLGATVFLAEAGKSQLTMVWSSTANVVVLGICGNADAFLQPTPAPLEPGRPPGTIPVIAPREVGNNDLNIGPLEAGTPSGNTIRSLDDTGQPTGREGRRYYRVEPNDPR